MKCYIALYLRDSLSHKRQEDISKHCVNSALICKNATYFCELTPCVSITMKVWW